MKVSEHFDIREFVPQEIWNQFGEKSMWFIDQRLVLFSEWLRAFCSAPVTINTWYINGSYTESGFRDPMTSTGAKLSQHKCGRAVDIKVATYTPEQLRQIVRDHWDSVKMWITTIEKDTPAWLHVDCRWTALDHLFEVPFK